MPKRLAQKFHLLFLGLILAPLAFSDQITYVFSGDASGFLGATKFTDAGFTITFKSDTADISAVPGFPNDLSTPAGTAATFLVDGVGGGELAGKQAVFINSKEEDVGIWFFAPPDFLTLGSPLFATGGLSAGKTYTLRSSIGPVTGTGSALSEMIRVCIGGQHGEFFSLTEGTLKNLSFTAIDNGSSGGGGGGTSIPEPASIAMTGAALCFLVTATRLRMRS